MPEDRLPVSPSSSWGRAVAPREDDAQHLPPPAQQRVDDQRRLRARLLKLIIDQERSRPTSAK